MKNLKQNICALIAAFIWGTAFVAQSVSSEIVEPFTMNGLRSLIGAVFLIVLVFVLNREKTISKFKAQKNDLIKGGFWCGLVLFFAINFQQFGISNNTSAGKAGFITALYIVLVPVFGLFLRKNVNIKVWISVAMAVVGLYLLCINEEFTISSGDLQVLICSSIFAIHILTVDHFVERCDGVMLSAVQFVVAGTLSVIMMFIFENPSVANITSDILPILYLGIMSSGIAYTLQIVAQKGSNPTVISLLMSMESVFAVVSGMIILKEAMLPKEYLGCAVMLAAVVLAQLPEKKLLEKTNKL